ncbi:MAG: hypothetical protein ACLQDL_00155 [Spirochaetia bacterium]
MTDFEEGFLLGILVGEGHFGGDGRQPQVTLRMHARHEELFRWLLVVVPGSALYGPYHHGGRNYFQWMTRGKTLREELLPILLRHFDSIDEHVRNRIQEMTTRYRLAEKVDGGWHLLESPRVKPDRPRR